MEKKTLKNSKSFLRKKAIINEKNDISNSKNNSSNKFLNFSNKNLITNINSKENKKDNNNNKIDNNKKKFFSNKSNSIINSGKSSNSKNSSDEESENSKKINNSIENNQKKDENLNNFDNNKRNNNYVKSSKSQQYEVNNIYFSEIEKIENDYDLNEYVLKLKIEEFIGAFFTLVQIISGIIYHCLYYFPNKNGIYKYNNKLFEFSKDFILCMCSVTALLYILSQWFRYHYILYINKCLGKILKKQSFFCYDYFGYFLLESIISLIHPNIFCKNKTFRTNKYIYRANTKYYINDFLLLICLCRVYVFYRFSIYIFKFYSPRMLRIAKLNGAKLTRLFLIKCLLKKHPFIFLLLATFIPLFTASYMVRITETPAYEKYIINNVDDDSSSFEYVLNNNDYRSIINCMWNIMISMTTVGYGDYYPITLLGKLICSIMTIWGICINSFMLVILQDLLFTMSDNEEEAFYEIEKNKLIYLCKNRSMELLISGLKYVNAKKKYIKSFKGKYPKKLINEYKNKLEDALYNKIEKRRKFKEIYQNYKNTYEFYKDEEIIKDNLNKFQNLLIIIENNCNELDNLTIVTNNDLDIIESKNNQK